MFLKCSWILLFKLHKNSTHLFHDSCFWNRCLYIGSRYYFMIIRLSWFCSCWYLYFMRFVFGYYEIKLFKRNLQVNCYIFNVAYVIEKHWCVLEMFLNCSWIFIAKIACHPEKNHKNLNISSTKIAFVIKWNNIFIIFEGLSFSEKMKMRKTGNSGHI